MGTVIGFVPPAAKPATNERLLFTFQVLIGYTVEVQVSDPLYICCFTVGLRLARTDLGVL